MKVKTHDTVFILTGKDRGRTGTVTKVLGKDRVLVEGINKMVKHVKGKNGQPGERIEFYAPVHISNVSLLDPKTGKPTRVGYVIEGNQKFRVAKKSGERIVPGMKKKASTKKAKVTTETT